MMEEEVLPIGKAQRLTSTFGTQCQFTTGQIIMEPTPSMLPPNTLWKETSFPRSTWRIFPLILIGTSFDWIGLIFWKIQLWLGFLQRINSLLCKMWGCIFMEPKSGTDLNKLLRQLALWPVWLLTFLITWMPKDRCFSSKFLEIFYLTLRTT